MAQVLFLPACHTKLWHSVFCGKTAARSLGSQEVAEPLQSKTCWTVVVSIWAIALSRVQTGKMLTCTISHTALVNISVPSVILTLRWRRLRMQVYVCLCRYLCAALFELFVLSFVLLFDPQAVSVIREGSWESQRRDYSLLREARHAKLSLLFSRTVIITWTV